MRGKYFELIFLVSFIFIIFSFDFVSSATAECNSCSDCSAKIASANANDTIQLNTSITFADNGTCINFSGNGNITFDCQNNFIQGPGNDNELNYGLYLRDLYGGSDNNAIINCNLSKFYIGFFLWSGANNTIANITANNNYFGIEIMGGDNNLIFNNTANSNVHYGIELYSSSDNNILTSNFISNNSGGGVSLQYGGSGNNTFLNNTFFSNPRGLLIYKTFLSTLRYNNFSENVENFYLSGGDVMSYLLNNTIDTSNIVDNKKIYYNYSISDYVFNLDNTPDAGMIYCANCTNVTIENLNLTSGISFYYTNNSLIRNVTSHDSGDGILLYHSSNNILSDITANSNKWNGVDLFYSSNNILSNLTTTLNNQSGIMVSFSRNNSLSDSLINANNFGVYLMECTGNYLDNLTIIDNSYNGINATSGSALILEYSSDNILNNSQIRRNHNVAFYLRHSDDNIVTGNIVENHSTGAIKFEESSSENLIYNNFFNSTLNYNESGSINNFFNTTKTLGTNIVGGDYIGGNFWGFMNGTGFSETCTDADGDDLCDNYYNLSDGSYDYLPLRLISFTLPDLPESVYSPKKSNSGGFLTPAVQTNQETQSIPKISAGSSASVSVKNSKIDIRNIKMSVNSNITNASLTVEGIEVENFTIPFPSGNLYKAFSITTKAISNEQLDNVTIDFRVNKTKLAEFNASYENVLLYRVPSNESLWQQLPTVSISDDNIYYYFSSISPGFSSFIIFIAEENIQCEVSQTRCFNDEVQICSDDKIWAMSEICDYGCNNGKCINFFSANVLIITYSVAGFILITIIFYYAKKNYKHEKKIPVKKNKISYNKNNKLDKFIR